MELAAQLNVKCDFTGHISQEELNASYKSADLLLVVSEHEGYCVPLIEAYHFGIPVVAYAAAAIPETAGEGAVLFKRRDPAQVALLANRIIEDGELQKRLSTAGNKVLQRYYEFPLQERLTAIVREVAQGI